MRKIVLLGLLAMWSVNGFASDHDAMMCTGNVEYSKNYTSEEDCDKDRLHDKSVRKTYNDYCSKGFFYYYYCVIKDEYYHPHDNNASQAMSISVKLRP